MAKSVRPPRSAKRRPVALPIAAHASFLNKPDLPPNSDGKPLDRPIDFDADTIRRERFDRVIHAGLGRLTGGISPASLGIAYADWLTHLSDSPGKQSELITKAIRKWLRFQRQIVSTIASRECAPCIEPLPQDHRFDDAAWQKPPYTLAWQAFLLTQQWWFNATTGIPGVARHHQDVVSFTARQILDIFSPSNSLFLNPVALKRTLESGGENLRQGFRNWFEDVERYARRLPPVGAGNFTPGQQVACTSGKVVFRNQLLELIQYAPSAAKVFREPVLIVPAWIMKYYILDLSPHNSLVNYLVDHGHTVFMISWKNPGIEDRDFGMEDYIDLGVMAALDGVSAITGSKKIHGVGYCLGGTLLMIAAAAMARDRDSRLASLTLLAAQTDFTDAGELMIFIDESQVAFLEDMMWAQGFLDTRQMAGAFQLLRSNDLIWSRVVHDYLMGEREPMSDLMAWNADATRMPYRMHSEYLRKLFLQNDLAEGRYIVHGRPIAVDNISVPIFSVATEWDHVAPWKSVYKLHLLTNAEITFLLTNGGHNAGIISEPGHESRTYRVRTRKSGDIWRDAENWFAETPVTEGSWWPEWQRWLAVHSDGKSRPPATGATGYAPLCDAPGRYVLQP